MMAFSYDLLGCVILSRRKTIQIEDQPVSMTFHAWGMDNNLIGPTRAFERISCNYSHYRAPIHPNTPPQYTHMYIFANVCT